jgi:hypothetical protein
VAELKNIIYGLTDPRDGALRYVGQSCKGMKRPQVHKLENALRWNTHKINWIKQLKSLGLEYGIVFIEEVASPDDLNAREIWWIAFARAWGCRLTNATDGGEGVRGLRFSEAALAKMSAAQTGRKHSEETKAKIAAGNLGKVVSEATKEKLRNRPLNPVAMAALAKCSNSKKNIDRLRKLADAQRGVAYTAERREQMKEVWKATGEKLRGRSFGDETRAKMSAAAKGRKCAPRSDEHRARLSAALTGRKFSAEHVERIRESRIGKTLLPETRAKIGAAHLGSTRSAETREKMRLAALGRRHSDETKAKISAAKMGRKETRPRSAEWRAKVSAANKGKKRSRETIERIRAAWALRRDKSVSEETRAKMSASQTGRTHTPETRAKMSEFRRQWWARRRAVKEILSTQQGPM